MPTFRIVYIEDDTFVPRTLTAAFPDRAAAEVAMAKHGHRVVHIAEMGAGERASDPVTVAMAAGGDTRREAGERERKERRPAPQPLLGLPRVELAGVAVIAASLAMAGAALLLF